MAQVSIIAQAVLEFFKVGWHIYGLFVEARKRGWIRDGSDIVSKIKGAQNADERMALAKLLFEHDSK